MTTYKRNKQQGDTVDILIPGIGLVKAVVPVDGTGAPQSLGGGGAITIAATADTPSGAPADAATDFGSSANRITLLAAIWKRLRGGQATKANSLPVVLATDSDSVPTKRNNLDASSFAVLATTGTLVAAQDVSGYAEVSFQITAIGSATVVAQVCNDNATWLPALIFPVGSGPGALSAVATGMWRVPLSCKYFRLQQTVYASGTTAGAAIYLTASTVSVQSIIAATQSGNFALANTPAKVGASTFSGQTISPSVDTSFGTATKNASKASTGNVFALDVTSVGGALVYFQIFNKATAPANGDTPIYSLPVPAGTATVPARLEKGENFFGGGGKNLATGIAWGISSTNATFTDAGTAANYNVHLHVV